MRRDLDEPLHAVVVESCEPEAVWNAIAAHLDEHPRTVPWDRGDDNVVVHTCHHHLLVITNRHVDLASFLTRNLMALIGDQIWYQPRVKVLVDPQQRAACVAMFGRGVWVSDGTTRPCGYLTFGPPNKAGNGTPVDLADGTDAAWYHDQTALCVALTDDGRARTDHPAPATCMTEGATAAPYTIMLGKLDDIRPPVMARLARPTPTIASLAEQLVVDQPNWWLCEETWLEARDATGRITHFNFSTDTSPSRIVRPSSERLSDWRLAVVGIALPDPDAGSNSGEGPDRVRRTWLDFDTEGLPVSSPLAPRGYALTIEPELKGISRGVAYLWNLLVSPSLGARNAQYGGVYNYQSRTPTSGSGRSFSVGPGVFVSLVKRRDAAGMECAVVQPTNLLLPFGYIELGEDVTEFRLEGQPNDAEDVISLAWLDHAGKVETVQETIGLGSWAARHAGGTKLLLDRRTGALEHRLNAAVPVPRGETFFLGPLVVKALWW